MLQLPLVCVRGFEQYGAHKAFQFKLRISSRRHPASHCPTRASLEAEIVALRHQLNVLRRKSPKRLAFSKFDRLIFASLYRIAPNVTP
jgi:hypothetical protein